LHLHPIVRLWALVATVDMGALARLVDFLVALACPLAAARHGLVGTQPKEQRMPPLKTDGVLSMVMHKWQAFPNTDDFAKSCADGLGKLLPELRMQYTAHQVPIFLRSECDVWATKKGYALQNASLDGDEYTEKSSPLGRLASKASPLGWSQGDETMATARTSCEHCAKLLGEEFFGKQDYLGWCKNVTGFLQTMKELPQLRTDIAKLRLQHQVLSAELEADRFNRHEANHKVTKMEKDESWWKRWHVRKSSGFRPLLSLVPLALVCF